MNKSQSISVGIFFIIGISLLWVVQRQMSDKAVQASEGYEVVARFENLLQLRVGDDIRMAGVRIGSVQYTGLKDRTPTAIFKIDNEFQIPSDSLASIGMAGLLGNNLVSIDMGSSPTPVSPGGEVKTQAGYDINHVVNEIGALSQQVGGALKNFEAILGAQQGEEGMFQTLGRLLKENDKKLTQTVSNLEAITAQLASGEGTLGKLLMEDEIYEELKTISADLQNTLSEGEALLSDTREIVAHVKTGQGTLGGLIYGETDLAVEVEAMIADLREFSAKLNNPDSTIGKLLTDDKLYGEVQGLMRKANQTLDGLGDSAPISAVGAVAKPLF
ncbi:MAG: MlaD family protein [Opitutales bacterium]|nr:MlaD family protein [Opitutales bacterium]